MNRSQGTTNFNAVAADGAIFSHLTTGSFVTGSTFSGSQADFKNLNGSTITGSIATIKAVVGSTISGSGLTLPSGGALGGMVETVTGSTAAAGANFSKNHSLGVTPTFVCLQAYATSVGSIPINLIQKGTGQIIVNSSFGTVAFEALVVK
jgi:hypothetical protein